MVELAMDDHSNARDYLQRAEARVASQALFASAVAEGVYSAHGDLEDDYEEFADVVTEYLMEDFDSADDRALKLMEIEDSVDEVLEKNRKISRRRLLLGGAGVAAAAAGGAFIGTQGSNNNAGGAGGNTGPDYTTTEASITDVSGIGNYLEGLTRREREEWSALWNVYDSEEDEFFPDQDNINLNGIGIRHREDPDMDSDYRLETVIDGNEDLSDWQTFEHDETAEDALEHFGEL